jgi:hypothetical protein
MTQASLESYQKTRLTTAGGLQAAGLVVSEARRFLCLSLPFFALAGRGYLTPSLFLYII